MFLCCIHIGQKQKLDDEVQNKQKQKAVPLTEMPNIELRSIKKNTQKVRWSEEEKEAVNRRLWRYMINAKIPGKEACEQCKQQEPCLQNRKWKNIKDFVRNRICANARRSQGGVR